MRKINLIVFSWFFGVLLLFVFSFTQIDLGLTLTRASFWQPVQRAFQQVGYFNRPVSTGLFLSILVYLFIIYLFLIRAARRKSLKTKQIWLMVLLTSGLLWFAYNAFSYDLFNYIFDAKIVTFYQDNPYQKKALDFPGDPMLGFMHWTHRLYPYGPVWLALTVPLSYLGWQKFVPTMLLFKALIIMSYLGCCWSISQLLEKKNQNIGLVVFAFTPLLAIEGLVSAHNDVLMMALILVAYYFFKKKKQFSGWLFFFLAGGVKFATLALLPVFLWMSWMSLNKRKINWNRVWQVSFFLMLMAVLAATFRSELKPWYLLYPLPFAALLTGNRSIYWLMTAVSAGVLLHYAPFLYLGNWDPPVPMIKLGLTLSFLAVGAGVPLLVRWIKK